MNMVTISIGIPAHNEAANIGSLLRAILQQKENNYSLKEIIVVSDGSTDDTVLKVKQINDKRIRIVDDGKRMGKSVRLNQIFSMFTGNILVLLDADIRITDKDFLDTLVLQTDFKKAGVAAPNYDALLPTNYFEKCLQVSLDVQVDLRKKWKNGTNYLSFKGACMALDRKFAKALLLPEKLVNNDGYIYFKALEKGYHPCYLPNLYVYYKSPSNFKDYVAQSSRYQASENELSQFVSTPENEYIIPKALYYTTAVKFLIKKPIYMFGYMVIRIAARLLKKKPITSQWTVATSTKQIHS